MKLFRKFTVNKSRSNKELTALYKSKWDRYFIVFITLCIILISAVFLVPQSIAIAAGATLSPLDHIIFFSLLVISNMLVIWPMLSIRYEMLDDYLLVKGGPFRSKIRYEDITKVEAGLLLCCRYASWLPSYVCTRWGGNPL